MKQHLLIKALFTLMAMLMVSTKMQAQEAEPYVVISEDYTVATFYYDNQMEARYGYDIAWAWMDDAVTVVFDPSFANCTSIASTKGWFKGCKKLTTIVGIENLKTDNVTDMRSMFYDCSSLTSLDVSHFNTANVTDMSYMFYDCSSLTSLDMSHFNTASVTDMNYMFYGCSSLTSLDVSHFNTANVTDMGRMFRNCSSLTSLDLSSFNTANVTDMMQMFYGCSSLTSLDLSSFNTANVTSMRNMFDGCSNLTSLDLSSFNTANVTGVYCMSAMFRLCSNLITIYVSSLWKAPEYSYIGSRVFDGCTSLVGGQGTVYDSSKTDATYARIDGGEEAPGYFTEKTATGIEGVVRNANLQPAYNLSGQRLTAPQRGINIIGGKKVVVR